MSKETKPIIFSDTHITSAERDDAAAIYKLILEAFGKCYLKFTIFQSIKSIEYIRDRIEIGNQEGSPEYYVIREGKALKGFYSAVRRGNEYFLNYIATDPSRRLCGSGNSLLNHFESQASSFGCVGVGLDVFLSNANAVAWYRRHNYKVERIRYYYRFDVNTLGDRNERGLELDEVDLEEALAKEKVKGFSNFEARFHGEIVRIGLINGIVCKIISATDLSALAVASAAARFFWRERKWFLLTREHPIPEKITAESMESVLYMIKRFPLLRRIL